ncbi:MAG: choice-of-anchor M domain-containing protein [Verrucomicrobiales bacterium]|nr:choice-of-anchor M domain-containing protein [Verrucomicrobiales bacterium]
MNAKTETPALPEVQGVRTRPGWRRVPALIAIAALLLCTALPCVHAAEERVSLTTGHVDLRIDYDAARSNLLEIVVSDDDQGVELPAASAILVVAESGRIELPGDLPPLGNSGDSLWVIPQSQDPGIVFLGLSAEQNPGGIFSGAIDLRLIDVRGPGNFFFWQSDLGSLNFFFDSSNGFGTDDSFPQLVGGHSHGNWGFTTNGIYFITLQAFGQRIGESTNIFSPPTVFEFHVEPVPTNTNSFQRWQLEQWPNSTDALLIGPEADPDQDGRLNLEEYALGTDPKTFDRDETFTPSIDHQAPTEPSGVEIRLRMRQDRSDVEPTLVAAPDPAGPWSPVDRPAEEVSPGGGASELHRILVWKVPFGVAPAAVRFYRVSYQLKLSL